MKSIASLAAFFVCGLVQAQNETTVTVLAVELPPGDGGNSAAIATSRFLRIGQIRLGLLSRS